MPIIPKQTILVKIYNKNGCSSLESNNLIA
jgi:hypothetical protein